MPPLGACKPAVLSCHSEFFFSARAAPSCSSLFVGHSRFSFERRVGGAGLRLQRKSSAWEHFQESSHASRSQSAKILRAQDGTGEAELFSPNRGDGDLWKVSAYGEQIPTQAESVTGATQTIQAEFRSLPDLDYLQELLAIQQSGPRAIGFFGTRNMGFMHQQLIEILSYAMVITKNHIYTSGASGTNAAVIRGALRAEMPELLTVILPQSLKKQPPESQDLLSKVKNVIEMPHNDHLPLLEASRLCNMDILSHVQQVICFAFHDSNLLMETCREAKSLRKIVTLFYLD
ncbi:hypothetical protein MPTK1_5g06930 [Marchantia polymorpha subsp. ruderalis]|uniref:Uncharacterized protein n=2 Tax=Marchantia polymorpha TaxID=3197 RepID=A0AAF6BFR5_MARPO|nr:hypothetical protein MARPO_0136s0029 [Marchantia polymorpha]BBN10849.1 hypothetical protein Mp_5g06930 [Marchantia polymorpha subsp. ruderalis]|eukprot:PTQ29702.1 hypothetical protein MARPO_0136s0029 [Marchantia polymorpha]